MPVRTSRLPNTTKIERIFDDAGQPIAVVRPSLPALAVKLAKRAARENDPELLQSIPQRIVAAGGSYTFAGWATSGEEIVDFVDGEWKVVDRMRAGDSRVSGELVKDTSRPN